MHDNPYGKMRAACGPVLASALALVFACSDERVPADPGPNGEEPDAGGGLNGDEPDASEPATFDGLELRLSPETPLPEHEFSLYVRAVDTNGDLYADYEGDVGVEASDGELFGATEEQLTEGTAFLPLRFDEELEEVTLTVTDQDDDSLSATTDPFAVFFEGEPGEPGDLVINEVNWYGPLANNFGTEDVWVELRNVSEQELNVSQWRLAGAGLDGNDVFLLSGTVLEPGEHLVVTNFDTGSIDGDNPDINAQVHIFSVPLELPNEGMQLALQDVEETVIDETPDPAEIGGGWPAGLANFELGYFESMQRRDDNTGGGYGDGADPDEWYTFNRGGGLDTTHPDSPDVGRPGFPNSDPNGRLGLPYETSFESGDARFDLDAPDDAAVVHAPPEGTFPRTGARVLSTTDLTESRFDRGLATVDCIELGDADDVRFAFHAMASEDSETTVEAGFRVEWHTSDACDIPQAVEFLPTTEVPVGEYEEFTYETFPQPGETHVQAGIDAEVDDESAEHAWAADDFRIEPIADE